MQADAGRMAVGQADLLAGYTLRDELKLGKKKLGFDEKLLFHVRPSDILCSTVQLRSEHTLK